MPSGVEADEVPPFDSEKSMPQLQYQLIKGKFLSYLLALPADHEKGPLPVLCFLHGYGEGAPTEMEAGLTRHGPLRKGNKIPAVGRFIVVVPHLPERGDVWRVYADAVLEIVMNVQRRHGGDPARTYLTGFSFGANGVFDFALLQPDFWAALWAVDPTRLPADDPQRPIWLSIGEIARGTKQHYIRALDLRPVVNGIGPDRIYHDEGADHVDCATLAYGDARIYTWLLTKILTSRRPASEARLSLIK